MRVPADFLSRPLRLSTCSHLLLELMSACSHQPLLYRFGVSNSVGRVFKYGSETVAPPVLRALLNSIPYLFSRSASPHFLLQILHGPPHFSFIFTLFAVPQNPTHCFADQDVVVPLAAPSLIFPFAFVPRAFLHMFICRGSIHRPFSLRLDFLPALANMLYHLFY